MYARKHEIDLVTSGGVVLVDLLDRLSLETRLLFLLRLARLSARDFSHPVIGPGAASVVTCGSRVENPGLINGASDP